MLDGIETGAVGKHPAREDLADLAVEGDFIHFDKGITGIEYKTQSHYDTVLVIETFYYL